MGIRPMSAKMDLENEIYILVSDCLDAGMEPDAIRDIANEEMERVLANDKLTK